ncbi:MAG: hypothetical protein A3F73_06365 [Gallionellales bacterium RIFCSPLOWO2_12_FULL_59_22]|nr:MAG: hypothetical protein A3H99_11250 [Gallionellales bacterium RIFCSPLOWO2_02_FULL_59_110]OGT03063.1 MAG: hypothetical protein A2Z65_02725 [Gallionellales bacterium RIFCSPLOWO2_02_58_13]OGT13425.1 MAG: hypothetical protein A3F73_06365 [Gallionellales bacterium RIFCSPLOWO2_12_FULL_59_22]
MKKTWAIGFAMFWGGLSAACAAPGEWWEVTAKMEMPGMPFAMPQTTTKVCIARDAVNDPRQSMQDKECKMTDIKTSGNKTTWKMRCVRDGETMNGTGEITSTADSYHGKMHLSGKSDGEDVNMTTTYRGKRVGPACDSSQPSPEMAAAQKQMDQSCDTTGRKTRELIDMADMFLAKNPLCPGKSKAVCEAIRKDSGRDAEVYSALTMRERHIQPNQISVAKSCGLDMAATTKSICKTLGGKNYNSLAPHCPAEAKAHRAAARKKECEGRSFTAREDLSRCLGAADGGDESDAAAPKPPSGKSPSAADNPAGAVIDGAKKLKGILGF